MESLDLLWELESQWNLLDSVEKELVDLDNGSGVKAMRKKVIALEKRLRSSKVQEEKAREKLTKLEKELSMNNFNIEEIEKGLYDGHTSDIKQLEFLNGEKDKLRTIINEIEVEVLELMTKLEESSTENKTIEDELKTIEDEESEVRNNHDSLIETLNNKVLTMEKKIKASDKKIDEKLLKEFYRIKKSRKTGIVELKDSVCMGCNIMNSTLAVERIKTTKDIYHCDSCGRILYHKA